MSALVGFRGYVDGDAAQTHVAVAVYDDGERLLARGWRLVALGR